MFESIPKELKNLKQWVCWKDGKIPVNPYTKANAQSNNPETWSDFETAYNCYKLNSGMIRGVGFMLCPPYFGVDLDKCIDDVDFVSEFVETLQSYNEISTSGNGIHIICKGEFPKGGKRRGNVEMYDSGRFFIMTGNQYKSEYSNVEDCSETIKILHNKYLHKEEQIVSRRSYVPADLDDIDVIEKATNCKTGNLFDFLYRGNWQGLYNSQSEADLAFCNHLAFWTQKNESQMDRIFRSSGLMRDKWDRSAGGSMTYGKKTIQQAILACREVYEPKPTVKDTHLAVGMFKKDFFKDDRPRNHYDRNDSGNAQRMRDMFQGCIKYSYERKKWMYWNGKRWKLDNTGEIKKLADVVVDDIKKEAFGLEGEEQEKLLKFACKTGNSAGKESMLKETQHLDGIPVLMESLDSHGMFLNVQNGIVSLSTGELIPHDSSFMMTKICNADYNQNETRKPEKWLSFLNDVTCGDKELQRYLQKCVGYSLTGSTEEQCAFFLYGIGNNGKSTFIETLADLFGDYSSNCQPDTIMVKKNDNGTNSDIARLKSARMVTTEEPTEGVRLNEGLVKQLTGGGKVTCRFLFGDEFEYEPEFKIWIATNHRPVIRGTDNGIWRRIRLIPFETNIPAEKVDKNLKYKLRKEFPMILKWAVDGCLMWKKEGLNPPEAVVESTKEYKTEMDLLQTFIDLCIDIDYTAKDAVQASDLYSVYKRWAEENGEFVMTSRKFFGEMTKKLPEKQRVSTGIVYKKIRLKQEAGKYQKRTYSADMFKS